MMKAQSKAMRAYAQNGQYRTIVESRSKAMRAYAQNGQYRTIVESRVCLTLVSLNYLVTFRTCTFYNTKS